MYPLQGGGGVPAVRGVYQVPGPSSINQTSNGGIPIGAAHPTIVATFPYSGSLQGSSIPLQSTGNPQANNYNPQIYSGGATLGGGGGASGQSAADAAAAAARAAAIAAAQRAATVGAINGTFAPVTANFDAIQADLDRTNAFNQKQVGDQYNSELQGLNNSNQEGIDNLNRAEGSVDYMKASNLRDLGNNIEAAMQSRLRQIGSAGAGSSSAGYQLGLALHGLDNQSRTSLLEQSDKQYGDINLQRTHLKSDYQTAVDQLNQWKTGEIARIANDYQNQKNQIDRMRAGADQSKQAAIAQMSVAAAQQAAAQLAQVQQTAQMALSGFTPNLAGGQAVAQKYNPTLAGYNYDTQGLTGADPSIQYSGGQPSGGSSFPVYSVRSKDQTNPLF